jgi:hypothetical protein
MSAAVGAVSRIRILERLTEVLELTLAVLY